MQQNRRHVTPHDAHNSLQFLQHLQPESSAQAWQLLTNHHSCSGDQHHLVHLPDTDNPICQLRCCCSSASILRTSSACSKTVRSGQAFDINMIRLGICKVLNMTNSQATLESCKLTAEAKPSATVTGPYMPPFGIAVSRVMGKHDVLTILQQYCTPEQAGTPKSLAGLHLQHTTL